MLRMNCLRDVGCSGAVVAPFTPSACNAFRVERNAPVSTTWVLVHLASCPRAIDWLMHFAPPRFDKVVEALMCLFPDKVRKKRISYSEVSTEGLEKIRGDATCRYSSDEDWATLVDHHCVAREDAGGAGKVCSCSHVCAVRLASETVCTERSTG